MLSFVRIFKYFSILRYKDKYQMDPERLQGHQADLLILQGREKILKGLPTLEDLAKKASRGDKYCDLYHEYSFDQSWYEIAIPILTEIVQRQSHQITITKHPSNKFIRIEWTINDWLTYPNFIEMALKEIYRLCLLHMKARFSEGNPRVDLSFLFMGKCYDKNILSRLQNIFRTDGFTLTVSDSIDKDSPNVILTRP
jgi:hypothetical protein